MNDRASSKQQVAVFQDKQPLLDAFGSCGHSLLVGDKSGNQMSQVNSKTHCFRFLSEFGGSALSVAFGPLTYKQSKRWLALPKRWLCIHCRLGLAFRPLRPQFTLKKASAWYERLQADLLRLRGSLTGRSPMLSFAPCFILDRVPPEAFQEAPFPCGTTNTPPSISLLHLTKRGGSGDGAILGYWGGKSHRCKCCRPPDTYKKG